MLANPVKSWFKRYWLWFLLAIAAIIYVFTLLLPKPKTDEKESIFKNAQNKAKKIKEDREKEHAAMIKGMKKRTQELTEIKAIKNEDERLKKLAEFANKE